MPSAQRPDRDDGTTSIESLLADDGYQTRAERRAQENQARERGTSATHGRREAGRARTKPRRKLSVVGVSGEVLMTLGVVMLLFVGWKYWLNDLIVGDEQNQAGQELSQVLAEGGSEATTVTTTDPAIGIPISSAPTVTNERFAILYVPTWGADYARPIAQGIEQHEVLDHNIGHYPNSQMPGEVGNFAIAGHRLAYGASMQKIHELQLGDELVVETADGWYTYSYRSGEYVAPTQVDVLGSVPRYPEQTGTDRLMMIMSCNPFWSTAERIIGYAVFDSFTPRADGPPASIAASVANQGGL
ncbi:class E sortase [Pseudoclavibacter helvolus]|uniref:class E sortase n=1 Tax=Pseudoclavibacter helvolus TaxID=255205 RepID=UPI003C719088